MPRSTSAPRAREVVSLAIESRIHVVRGVRVMLSTDLALLYGVEPKALVQAVRRNRDRFPKDFLFQLKATEQRNLKSQSVTSSWGGARRARPYAFTEQGVAMLSSVLRSARAVRVNVEIMRAFVRLRHVAASVGDLARKLDELEQSYDAQFRTVFQAIRQLMEPPAPPRRRIGFVTSQARPGAVSGRGRAGVSGREVLAAQPRNAASSSSTGTLTMAEARSLRA